MNDYIFRFYGFLHLTAKRCLGRKVLGVTPGIHFPARRRKADMAECTELWKQFISNSVIPDSVPFHYAGYIEDIGRWCLPSWIWTNAALVRTLLHYSPDTGIELANALLDKQHESGGWIVRNDYDKQGPIPVLAPNDSAYIANNAMLEAFTRTNDNRFLQAAIKCADWIMETAREDGIVHTGFNARDGKWDKSCVIVDTGFTAGLFAKLYSLTECEKYRKFLERFINRYVELFYIPGKKAFCTSIDSRNRQQGGMFGRGQAWALEGLIPAYKVLSSGRLKEVIENTLDNLDRVQTNDGGWPYNLAQPMMGTDCKGVPVIAHSILEWSRINNEDKYLGCVRKALDWCVNHTESTGQSAGGIFSYTIEGGIVKDLYSSCAFVYASAYALEVEAQLNNSK